MTAPRIPMLLADDDTGFLPADMPSRQAFAKLREEFPGSAPASRAVVVFVREAGLTPADRSAIGALARALQAQADVKKWTVHAAATAPYLKPMLESRDGAAALIVVDFPAEMLTHSTVARVRSVKASIEEQAFPAGLEVHVTGSGALGELLDATVKGDVDQTTWWAFAGVTFILLIVYRSPVSMLLPVVTIVLSLMVSLGLLGWSASLGWPINGLVEMFIVVILVGTSVDYCLFLFARFREEMEHGADSRSAVDAALAQAGGAILASAGTNAAALATLVFGRNRDLYTSGPTIALAICVAAFAVLTLTPSLMRLVGRYLVWPNPVQARHGVGRALWTRVGRLATHRPIGVTLVVVGALAVPAFFGMRVQPLYHAREEYPPDSSFVRGAQSYEEHFHQSKGVIEQTLIVSTDERLDTPEALPALRRALDAIASELSRDFSILHVRDLQDPLGDRRAAGAGKAPGVADRIAAGFTDRLARAYYMGQSGTATRIDFAVHAEPGTVDAMELLPGMRAAARRAIDESGLLAAIGATRVRTDLVGETPLFADIRSLRTRDFRVIATAAILVVYLILVGLTRSMVQSAILVSATLLTYLATYGGTWIIFHYLFGVRSLSYELNFLLFIIILALGQDYNIYVVSRIREELCKRPPGEAIAQAVQVTGGVVSSCGIIMAAAFASMYCGSLLIMKEYAVALAMGILIDTFVVRPLLVPALILLIGRPTQNLPVDEINGRRRTIPTA